MADLTEAWTVATDEATRTIALDFDGSWSHEKAAAPLLELQLDNLPPWPFGLGVVFGPSGSGKSRWLRHLRKHYGHNPPKKCYEGEFPEEQAVVSNPKLGGGDDALNRLQSVGLNSVPAWTRPMHVLSTGQQARVRLALELSEQMTIDDFAAVVDLQTARSTATALARRVKTGLCQGVLVATTRAEVVPWLAADFLVNAATNSVIRRPAKYPVAAPSISLIPNFGCFVARKDCNAASERCGWIVRAEDPRDQGAKPPEPLKWRPALGAGPLISEHMIGTQKLTCKVVVDEAVEKAAAAFEYTFDGHCETDVPHLPICSLPLDYRIGVLVGPSGTGKSTLLKNLGEIPSLFFPDDVALVTALADIVGVEAATELLNALALPEPCWLRPRRVLSTGEGDRADVAMALAFAVAHPTKNTVAIDEWTSTLDRATAKITCEKLSCWLRSADRLSGVVFATVHEDIVGWLQPNWAFHTGTRHLTKEQQCAGASSRLSARNLRTHFEISKGGGKLDKLVSLANMFASPSMSLEVTSLRFMTYPHVKALWEAYFEEHHYLRGDLSAAAACLVVREKSTGAPVAFHASLPFPGRVKQAWREHRVVTRPEWQGLRIGPMLSNLVAARFHADGFRFYSTTAHPRFAASRNSKDSGWVPSTGSAPDGSRLSEGTGIGHNIKKKKKLNCSSVAEIVPDEAFNLDNSAIESETIYLVDNSELQSKFGTLMFRQTMVITDKAKRTVSWGSTVVGTLVSPGWVRVKDLFLPEIINESRVLFPLKGLVDTACAVDAADTACAVDDPNCRACELDRLKRAGRRQSHTCGLVEGPQSAKEEVVAARRRRRVFSHRYVGMCGRCEHFGSTPTPCGNVRCLKAAQYKLELDEAPQLQAQMNDEVLLLGTPLPPSLASETNDKLEQTSAGRPVCMSYPGRKLQTQKGSGSRSDITEKSDRNVDLPSELASSEMAAPGTPKRKRSLACQNDPAPTFTKAVKKRRECAFEDKSWVCPVPTCGHRMVKGSAGCLAHVATNHRKEEYLDCKAKANKIHHGCAKCVPPCYMDVPGIAFRWAVTSADAVATADSIASLLPWSDVETKAIVTEARQEFIAHKLKAMSRDECKIYAISVVAAMDVLAPTQLGAEAEGLFSAIRAEVQ